VVTVPGLAALRPLLRASGVNTDDAITYGETHRYSSFGALILFTTAMSAASAGLAVAIATDLPMAAVVAIAAGWGFGIFHLDRWLVSTPIPRADRWRRVWLLLSRLAIAVPMGLLVAWFAMLGLAAKEIEQQLDADRIAAREQVSVQLRDDSDLARQRATLVAEKQQLADALKAAEQEIPPLQKAYDDECSGEGGTRTKGCGPIAQRKLRELEAAQRNRDAARRILETRGAAIDGEARSIDEQIRLQVIEVSRSTDTNDGLFARRAALSRVLASNAEARHLFWLVQLVLIVVDVLPALVKVLSPTTMVDAAAEAERTSPDIEDALRYAAGQRAETFRDFADARRQRLTAGLVPGQPRNGPPNGASKPSATYSKRI